MNDRGQQPVRWASATFVLFGLLGLASASNAGTGRLLSQWMTRAPRIDGQMVAGEWSEAALVDLGAGVTVRIGNDARTLYVGVVDTGNLTYESGDWLELQFDDEGGVAPVHDDGAWTSSTCQSAPTLGEGLIDFLNDQSIAFQELLPGYFCDVQLLNDRIRFHSVAGPEGVTYEVAIPLDGPAPLHAGPGERFGILIKNLRDGGSVACLPSCGASIPPLFRNLVLASGGCNTGPQNFGSGDPLIGLPLDWTSANTAGSGAGWVQAAPAQYGDPVFCQANDTGGAGGAACVANVSCATPRTDSQLRMPLALAGQTSAAVRLRAVLVVDPNGQGSTDYLSFDLWRQNSTGNSLGFWIGQDQSATITLPLPLTGSPPVEFWLTHSTALAGGTEGGYAQADDVELLCGPVLFADGFESGLTTHWSTDAP